MSSFFVSLYDYFKTKRWLLAVSCLLFAGLAASLIFRLELTEDITDIMPAEASTASLFDFLQETEFSERLVVHLSTKDTTGDADRLIQLCNTAVDSLRRALDATLVGELVYQIDESQFLELFDIFYQHLPLFLEEKDYTQLDTITAPEEIPSRIRGLYKVLMSPAGFAVKKSALRDPLNITSLALEKLTSFQLDDNFELHQGYIMTKDRQHLLFFVMPAQSVQETWANQQLVQILDQQLKGLTGQEPFEGLQAEYFGAVAVAVGNAYRIRWDVTLTVGIALFVLFLFVSYFYQRLTSFFLIALPVLFGGLAAIALLSVVRGKVSLIAVGVGSVLLGIALDYALHVFTHYRSKGTVARTIKDLTVPIFLSALTTATAFLCLFFVRSEALHDLGLFAAFSVVATAFFALFLLPHFLKKSSTGAQKRTTFLDRFAAYPLQKNRWMLGAILVITILTFAKGFKVHFEDDLNTLNYMSPELKQAEASLQNLTSLTQRGVYMLSRGATIDEALQKNEAVLPLLDSLSDQGLITNYTGVTPILSSRKKQQEKIDRWNAFWNDARISRVEKQLKAEAAKLKFKSDTFQPFFELLRKEFTYTPPDTFQTLSNLFLRDFMSKKQDQVALISILRLEQDKKSMVYKAFEDNDTVDVLDKEMLIGTFVEVLKEDFDKLVLISLLLVFILLNINYGRPELAIIAFIPIALSWLWTLGLMNWFGLSFNIVNIIIVTFIFGLGIDYSIFVMQGLMQKYKYGEQNLPSYKTSILLSLITTMTGIGVLIFAQHPALKSIAALSVIGVPSVCLLAFTLEPLLFNWLVYKKGKLRPFPLTFVNMFATLFIYFLLVAGCIIISMVAILLELLIFIPRTRRKHWLTWMIQQLSHFYIFSAFPVHRQYLNPTGEDFSKPAVVISNHQSLIDTPMMFGLHPKVIILTNKWVYNFPLFHLVCRLADYFPKNMGMEKMMPALEKKAADNYKIAVFPEGSRSLTEQVNRFHKGAFYMAEQLELDIVPIYIHGTGAFLHKTSFWGKRNDLMLEVGERIAAHDTTYGRVYSERTKAISKQFKAHYAKVVQRHKTAKYFRRRLMENYIYKGTITEWYIFVKIRLEDYYQIFDELVPAEGQITDIGCGYGMMDYMLMYLSEGRNILGIDYDEEKVKLAQHCRDKNDRIHFEAADIAQYDLPESDAFIMADVLHYLLPEEQYQLLDRCVEKLHPGGCIIIRDGDRDKQKRHVGTRITEIISTNSGFNKTRNPLYFISGTELEAWSRKNNLSMERVDLTKFTSNIIFVIRKNQ